MKSKQTSPFGNSAVATITRGDGSKEIIKLAGSGFNTRVNSGSNYWYNQLINASGGFGGGSAPLSFALSSNVLSVALTDVYPLNGEITETSLARAICVAGGYSGPTNIASPDNGFSFTLSYSWTSDETTTVNSAAIYGGTGTPILICEANLATPAVLIPTTQLQLVWTINS